MANTSNMATALDDGPTAASSGNDVDITRFVHEMPKAELHVHLEGCLTPALARKFAERNKLNPTAHLSSLDQSTGYDFHDLTSFLAIYYPNMEVLQTELDFRDLAYDYLTRASQQNVKHCELFFDPQGRRIH